MFIIMFCYISVVENEAHVQHISNHKLMTVLMFMDPCIIVTVHKEKSNKLQLCTKFYYSIFIRSSTCFGRHTDHQQGPKTTLAASGFSYVEGC
jgi:hypothetical protein